MSNFLELKLYIQGRARERERVGFPQLRVLSILFNKDGWTKLGKVDENNEGVSHSNLMVAKVLSHPFELMLFKNHQLLYLFFNFLSFFFTLLGFEIMPFSYVFYSVMAKRD